MLRSYVFGVNEFLFLLVFDEIFPLFTRKEHIRKRRRKKKRPYWDRYNKLFLIFFAYFGIFYSFLLCFFLLINQFTWSTKWGTKGFRIHAKGREMYNMLEAIHSFIIACCVPSNKSRLVGRFEHYALHTVCECRCGVDPFFFRAVRHANHYIILSCIYDILILFINFNVSCSLHGT